jgi:hypothetical protein
MKFLYYITPAKSKISVWNLFMVMTQSWCNCTSRVEDNISGVISPDRYHTNMGPVLSGYRVMAIAFKIRWACRSKQRINETERSVGLREQHTAVKQTEQTGVFPSSNSLMLQDTSGVMFYIRLRVVWLIFKTGWTFDNTESGHSKVY